MAFPGALFINALAFSVARKSTLPIWLQRLRVAHVHNPPNGRMRPQLRRHSQPFVTPFVSSVVLGVLLGLGVGLSLDIDGMWRKGGDTVRKNISLAWPVCGTETKRREIAHENWHSVIYTDGGKSSYLIFRGLRCPPRNVDEKIVLEDTHLGKEMASLCVVSSSAPRARVLVQYLAQAVVK